MFKAKNAALAAMLLGLAAQGSVQAASVTTDAGFNGSTVITFNGFDGLLTTGPLDVGAEVGETVTLTGGPFVEVGAFERDLGENGLWGARGNPIDGLIDTPTGNGNFVASSFVGRRGEVGFSFDSAVARVGAYMNQFQQIGVSNSFTLLAYDQAGNVLETFNYSVNTAWDSYNEGQFLGFQRATADIYGFGVAGNNIALDNLSFSAQPVPEPESYALLLGGLGVVAWIVRRRRPV